MVESPNLEKPRKGLIRQELVSYENRNGILYRKTDNKFFLIDWDNVQYLKNKDECYNFYKEQLCDHRWQDTFKMNRKEVEKIFDEEWNNVH